MSFRVYYFLQPAGFSLAESRPAPCVRLREQLGVAELVCVPGPRQFELYLADSDPASNGVYVNEAESFRTFLAESGCALAEHTACERASETQALTHYFRSALGWLSEGERNEQQAKVFRIAHAEAQQQAQLSVQFNRLFERALWLTEKVRLETDFFTQTPGLATALLEVAGKIFGGLENRTALVLGNNMEAARAAQALRDADIGGMVLLQKAAQAEDYLNSMLVETAREKSLAPLPDLILIFEALHPQFDDPRLLQKLMAKRQRAPLLLADLSGSLTQAAAFQKMYNLFFFARTDLNRLVEQNSSARAQIENKITQWIADEISNFQHWLASPERFHFGKMVGSSSSMQAVFELIARIARTDITVLIQGESGTGKELVAAAVRSSWSIAARFPKACWRVNCSATYAARSRARLRTRRACSKRRTWARSSSMRSANCRRNCK